MKWFSVQQDEQQELWNTLEVLMHGTTAAEVRCAQQRLEKMQSRMQPHLAPATRNILTNLLRAAACASHGGEQQFYWLTQVENHWRAFTLAMETRGSGKRAYEAIHKEAATAN